MLVTACTCVDFAHSAMQVDNSRQWPNDIGRMTMGFPVGTTFVTVPTPSGHVASPRCGTAAAAPHGDCLHFIGKPPAPRRFYISFCLAGRGRLSCSTLHVCYATHQCVPVCSHLLRYASTCVSRGGSASVCFYYFSWERSSLGLSRLIIYGRLLSDVCFSCLPRK